MSMSNNKKMITVMVEPTYGNKTPMEVKVNAEEDSFRELKEELYKIGFSLPEKPYFFEHKKNLYFLEDELSSLPLLTLGIAQNDTIYIAPQECSSTKGEFEEMIILMVEPRYGNKTPMEVKVNAEDSFRELTKELDKIGFSLPEKPYFFEHKKNLYFLEDELSSLSFLMLGIASGDTIYITPQSISG